jgi:outer membrane protein
MMQRNHWLISGSILAIAAAAPAFGETLSEALASAYASNPTLLSERAKLRSTDELVPQALANWRPNVTLSGNVARSYIYESITSGAAVPGQAGQQQFTQTGTLLYNNQTVGVTVTQPLYRGGRTAAQTRQAEAQVEAERANLQVTESQILLNVATVYMNLVQAQAVLQLSINNEQVLQRQLEATEDRFRVGEVTRTDVAQAQSRLSAAHADRTQAEGGLRTARAAYVQTVGHDAGKTETPTQLPPVPASVAEAQGVAAEESPAIRFARYGYQAAVEGVDLIEGELLPQVSLTGVANRYYNFDGPQSLENAAQVMVGVTVPLYQQGQEYARLRGQKETAAQMRHTLDQAERDVRESTTAAFEALQTGHARRISYQAQIEAAEIALEGVSQESRVGSRTVLDVLNAEQELLTAQVNAVQAAHDEMVAAYQLLNAEGRLSAERLGLAVEFYDPARHYEEVRDKWIGFGDSLPDEASSHPHDRH